MFPLTGATSNVLVQTFLEPNPPEPMEPSVQTKYRPGILRKTNGSALPVHSNIGTDSQRRRFHRMGVNPGAHDLILKLQASLELVTQERDYWRERATNAANEGLQDHSPPLKVRKMDEGGDGVELEQ